MLHNHAAKSKVKKHLDSVNCFRDCNAKYWCAVAADDSDASSETKKKAQKVWPPFLV